MDVHTLADYVFLGISVIGIVGLWLLFDIRRALHKPCHCHEDRYLPPKRMGGWGAR